MFFLDAVHLNQPTNQPTHIDPTPFPKPQTLLYVQLHNRGKRTLHRLLLRRTNGDGEYADDNEEAGAEGGGTKHPRRRRSSLTSFHLHAHNLDREEGDGTSTSSSSSSSDGDGGGEGEGWGLRTGEVAAQRTFLQLLELTDVRDEPGQFFNDDATRAAQLLAEAEGRRAPRRRSHSASSGSGGSPPAMVPQQQRAPGQPRQRRRSTLGMGATG